MRMYAHTRARVYVCEPCEGVEYMPRKKSFEKKCVQKFGG